MSKANKIIILILIIIAVLIAAVLYLFSKNIDVKNNESKKEIENNSVSQFDWNAVLDKKSNLIRVKNLKPNDKIKSPLVIEGEARGSWYFEASFPVKLLDENGKLIAAAAAMATSDWMTTDFVPFKVTLEFSTPNSQVGTIVFEKDNPSDLPENADSLSFPIKF